MSLVDFILLYVIPNLGIGVRWMKEELRSRGVSVKLTATCLREFVMNADVAARAQVFGARAEERYVSRLRRELTARAEFVKTWTLSDERIDSSIPGNDGLIRLARKYALPRPWRLSDPVVLEYQSRTPNYLHWASA